MTLDLDDALFDALRAVCRLYLAETRYVLSAGFCGTARQQAEIFQRRDACEAVLRA